MTDQLTAVVVDDEKLARQYMLEMLAAFPDIRVVAECADGFAAVKAVNEHRPQLLFLDIQMPRLDGFEVLELVETDNLCVVFVTAFDQYAVRAFDSHAVDYLLKPFSKERLGAAIEKVKRHAGSGLPAIHELRKVVRKDAEYLTRVVVKDGPTIQVIPCADIVCITAEDDYVNIRSTEGSVLKHQSLAGLEESLDPDKFVRIHRCSMVNIERLDRIELLARDKYVAVLQDGTELRISRSGHQRLKELLG